MFTQENKELLLKDLCARLPYGVKCKYYNVYDGEYNNGTIIGYERQEWMQVDGKCIHIEDIKPYLFPLSSMTVEQRCKVKNLLPNKCDISFKNQKITFYNNYNEVESIQLDKLEKLFNFFNLHHIDYKGLIEKSLALDATNLGIYE